MDAYKNHPARKRAQAAPKAANFARSTSASGATRSRPKRRESTRSTSPTAAATTGRSAQRVALEVAGRRHRDQGRRRDQRLGAEIWNLLESRGITNVMLMGVHTNMCVLGRPFGLRNLARSGKNVVLVRDLTDTMYNSRMWPYVSHFEGTNRIIEHVEKYVAPTITSTDLTGQPAFRFQPDNRPRAVFLIGEDEYKTETTLPAFANQELEPLGVRCTFVIADPKSPHDFQGHRGARDADLLVLSVRRRAPRPSRWRSFANTSNRANRSWASARPAMRSTRAARPPRVMPNGRRSIPTCWAGITPGTMATRLILRSRGPQATRPIRSSGISRRPSPARDRSTKSARWLSGTHALLMGTIPGQPSEPVAWVNMRNGSRVFYTSLGHPDDFENTSFRKLLRNAVFWALDRPPCGTDKANTTVPGPARRDGAHFPFDRGQGRRSPRAALASFKVPDDLQLDLVLAEPVVRQPVSISFDERGRLWVVQYLQYPYPGRLEDAQPR